MSTTQTPASSAVARIIATPIIHEAHGRVTRKTWAAAVVLEDGTHVLCSHRDGHRSIQATTACAAKLAREHGWTAPNLDPEDEQ